MVAEALCTNFGAGSVGKRSADGATGNLAAISESARRALSIL
jgi:hypothetical protein